MTWIAHDDQCMQTATHDLDDHQCREIAPNLVGLHRGQNFDVVNLGPRGTLGTEDSWDDDGDYSEQAWLEETDSEYGPLLDESSIEEHGLDEHWRDAEEEPPDAPWMEVN